MPFNLYDILGSAGALLIVLTYLALQTDRLHAHSLGYSVCNAIGAGLILLSLVVHRFNAPAFLIEFFWLMISFYGIARAVSYQRAKRTQNRTPRGNSAQDPTRMSGQDD